MNRYLQFSYYDFYYAFKYWSSRTEKMHKEYASNKLLRGYINIRLQVFSSELIKELIQ